MNKSFIYVSPTEVIVVNGLYHEHLNLKDGKLIPKSILETKNKETKEHNIERRTEL